MVSLLVDSLYPTTSTSSTSSSTASATARGTTKLDLESLQLEHRLHASSYKPEICQ